MTAQVEACDEPSALPHLALVTLVPFCRDLDRGLVVVRFNPVGGRDLIDPIEAIKPVA